MWASRADPENNLREQEKEPYLRTWFAMLRGWGRGEGPQLYEGASMGWISFWLQKETKGDTQAFFLASPDVDRVGGQGGRHKSCQQTSNKCVSPC